MQIRGERWGGQVVLYQENGGSTPQWLHGGMAWRSSNYLLKFSLKMHLLGVYFVLESEQIDLNACSHAVKRLLR